MFNTPIDFENVKDEFSIIPQGEYVAIIETIGKYMWADKQKHDKSNFDGAETSDDFIEVRFNIIDERCKGRVHFESFNMWSDNDKMANIGRSKLKKLCAALNLDPSSAKFGEFKDKPLFITIQHTTKKFKQNGDPYVNVSRFRGYNALDSSVNDKIENTDNCKINMPPKKDKNKPSNYGTDSAKNDFDDVPF